MTARILSGREPAEALLDSLRPSIQKLKPKLVIVQVGNDPESSIYVSRKLQACEQVGMRCQHWKMKSTISFGALLKAIKKMNDDASITGYIVQLPLPSGLDEHMPLLAKAMDPMKDVDGFTAYNLGKVLLSTDFEHLPPATPAGVILLLEEYRISVLGKNVTIVGASNIVGKPLAAMLLNRGATVTVCHKETRNLAMHTKTADIVITAVGKPGLIKGNMLRKGAIVIDIGITRTDDGVVGDVDEKGVMKVAKALTPVPGGVGPMTVACLIKNVVTAKLRQMERKRSRR